MRLYRIALLVLLVGCGATEPHASHSPPVETARQGATDHVPEGLNAVQNEMLLLDEAVRDAVTAIANDDLEALPHGFHRVHMARGLTVEAIEAGAYRTPRNADQMGQFEAMDAAFHLELDRLLGYAEARDLQGSTQQLGAVLQQCTACHEQFRFEPR